MNAESCHVKPRAIHDRIPPERVLAVEALVQGRVTRYELRPDVYGPAPTHDCRCRESAA